MDRPSEVLSTSAQRGTADRVDQVARAALDELLGLRDVGRVGLALTEGGGRRLRFTASDRDRTGGVVWCDIDAYDDVPLTTVVRTARPILGDLDGLDPRFDELVDRLRSGSVQALAAVPLVGTGPPVGGLVLFYERRQPFDDDQRADLVRRAAGLAERIRRAQAVAPRGRHRLGELPVGPGVRVCDLDIDAHPRAVGETRRHLRGSLAAWGLDDDTADTAVLCLSELVTNAVIHTGAPAEMRATLDQGVLTVTVRDLGAAARPPVDGAAPAADPLQVHGRGLQVVDALAERWGSELDAEGTTVWFVLTAAAADG